MEEESTPRAVPADTNMQVFSVFQLGHSHAGTLDPQESSHHLPWDTLMIWEPLWLCEGGREAAEATKPSTSRGCRAPAPCPASPAAFLSWQLQELVPKHFPVRGDSTAHFPAARSLLGTGTVRVVAPSPAALLSPGVLVGLF